MFKDVATQPVGIDSDDDLGITGPVMAALEEAPPEEEKPPVPVAEPSPELTPAPEEVEPEATPAPESAEPAPFPELGPDGQTFVTPYMGRYKTLADAARAIPRLLSTIGRQGGELKMLRDRETDLGHPKPEPQPQPTAATNRQFPPDMDPKLKAAILLQSDPDGYIAQIAAQTAEKTITRIREENEYVGNVRKRYGDSYDKLAPVRAQVCKDLAEGKIGGVIVTNPSEELVQLLAMGLNAHYGLLTTGEVNRTVPVKEPAASAGKSGPPVPVRDERDELEAAWDRNRGDLE